MRDLGRMTKILNVNLVSLMRQVNIFIWRINRPKFQS